MPPIAQHWRGFQWALLTATLVALAYGPAALQAEYVHDDFAAVIGHPQVVWPLDFAGLAKARYFGGADYAYVFALRPLATGSFALEIGLGLDSPLGRHLSQLFLLLSVSALTAALLLRWGRLKGWSEPRAWTAAGLSAALFAVHPVHTEAVMAVAYRPELLSALFLLIGTQFLLSLTCAPQGRLLPSAGLFLTGLAALLSKESAAAGLVWWALWALAERRSWARLRWTWLPIAGSLAAWLAWRFAAMGALLKVQVSRHDNPLAHVAWPERLIGGLDLTGKALSHLLFPWHLAPDYTFDAWPAPQSPTLWAVLGLATLTAGGAWTMARLARAWRQNSALPKEHSPVPPLPHGGWLLALGLLGAWLPVSHLLTPGTVLFADRLLTLPSLLLAVGAAAALAAKSPSVQAGVAALLLLPAVGQTRAVAQDWTSSLAVFERGVRLEPRSLRMRLNLAHTLTVQARASEALPHASAALALDPADPKVWVAGLDAALAAKDCPAAEPFAAAAAASDKQAPTARLAALAWGMECRQFPMAWAIARRIPTARLSPKHALDLYALAHAAGDAEGAMALAQRLGVDVARQPAWVSAAVFGQRSAGHPLEALAMLADLQRRQPSEQIVRQATEIIAGLADPAQRAAAQRIWPGD